ncbi:hypothetical protein CF326_g4630 [Tilletia indica]|nr:hypothetical protein CF326_g4630 [Tilletia indica]
MFVSPQQLAAIGEAASIAASSSMSASRTRDRTTREADAEHLSDDDSQEGDNSDPENEAGEEEGDAEGSLSDEAELALGANRTARKRRAREPAIRKATLTPAAVTEVGTLKKKMLDTIKDISQRYNVSHSAIRKELGYSVEFGRAASPYHRWAKWYAAMKPNPKPGDLPARNREVARLWAELQENPAKLAKAIEVVDKWHIDHVSHPSEDDAKKILDNVAKQATKLVKSAASNDRVAIVVIAAHAHSLVSPSVIATNQTIKLFEASLPRVESVAHLTTNFHALVTATPPFTGGQTFIDMDEIPIGVGDDRYNDRWAMLKKAVPLHLTRIVAMGLANNDIECPRWKDNSSSGTRMVYLQLFDILAEVGLCMDGWPVACVSLLTLGSHWADDDQDTVIVRRGSLEHWNTWPRDVGRQLYAALCAQSIRVRLVTPVSVR